MLAVRPLEGYTTMGRETFLARVEWENDWPVVNPGVGRLTDTVEINLPKWTAYTAESNEYVFSTMGSCRRNLWYFAMRISPTILWKRAKDC